MAKFSAVVAVVFVVLVLTVPPLVTAQDDGGPIPIAYGETVQGTITDEQYEFHYIFTASQGDQVYVSVVEPGNTYVSLVMAIRDNSTGEIILEEDSWASMFVLEPFEIPADGDYVLDLGRYRGAEGSGTSSFILTIDRTEWQALEPGTPVEGTLTVPAATHFWTFEGSAGQVLSIKGTGVGLEFELYGPINTWPVIGEGPTNDPAEEFVLLPDDGAYRLIVQTENLEGTAYTLTVQAFEPVEVEVGQTVEGTIGGELSPGYYSVYATPDTLLRLEVASDAPDFEGSLAVYNTEGFRKEWVYGSAEDAYQLLLEPWFAAEEGRYFVVVEADERVETEIPYTLAVQPSALVPLVLNEAASGILDEDHPKQGYALQGAAEKAVTVSVRQVDGHCTPQFRIRNREYADFTLGANRWATAFSAEMTFPAEGFYIFTVEQGYYEDACRFEVLVSAPDESGE
jgi:hypothetical protein